MKGTWKILGDRLYVSYVSARIRTADDQLDVRQHQRQAKTPRECIAKERFASFKQNKLFKLLNLTNKKQRNE
jgi:hypothetical protein